MIKKPFSFDFTVSKSDFTVTFEIGLFVSSNNIPFTRAFWAKSEKLNNKKATNRSLGQFFKVIYFFDLKKCDSKVVEFPILSVTTIFNSFFSSSKTASLKKCTKASVLKSYSIKIHLPFK